MEFLGSLMYTIISSINKDTSTFSFIICIPFIALAKISSTMLNTYEKNGQSCVTPDFNGIALSFFPLNSF